MCTGIIGSADVGGSVAGAATAAGHDVILPVDAGSLQMARPPEELALPNISLDQTHGRGRHRALTRVSPTTAAA